jgi:hypothetical protein
MKKPQYTPEALFADFPESAEWRDVVEFADWYMARGAPMAIPWDAEVIVSDDATAICLFRQAPYQVELYLVHPNMEIPVHSHPGMDSFVVKLGGGELGERLQCGVSSSWGAYSGITRRNETHGGSGFDLAKKGYAMLTFQKWPNGVPMTSAAVHWQGETAGPRQEALIRRHNPSAVSAPGYADITKKPTESVL